MRGKLHGVLYKHS